MMSQAMQVTLLPEANASCYNTLLDLITMLCLTAINTLL
jgi:hypothetical protein